MMARLEQEVREIAFKNYVADSLQAIPQHKHLTKRYAELVDFSAVPDTRSGREIANDIIKGAGITIA